MSDLVGNSNCCFSRVKAQLRNARSYLKRVDQTEFSLINHRGHDVGQLRVLPRAEGFSENQLPL